MEELDLKELVNTFWNKKVIILLLILISIVLGVIYTIGFTKPVYTSSTTLVLASANNSSNSNTSITATDISVNSKLVSTYSELIKSKNILRQVIDNLGIKVSEDTIKNNIKVTSVSNTELIKISVTNEKPEYATKIANEIAKVFAQKVKELYNIENIQVVDEAEIPEQPSNINHKKDIMMFAIIGGIISILYVCISTILDTTIKTSEELENKFKLTVLATIPVCDNSLQKKKGGK